jgi:predicted Zn-ribbon and HTH transcriptional regulator
MGNANAKEKFIADISDFIQLLSNDRSQDVIARRFGLGAQNSQTLEKIGAAYHITRERVRQIENDALKSLRSKRNESIEPYMNALHTTIEQNGGFMREDALVKEFVQANLGRNANEEVVVRGGVLFLLNVSPHALYRKEDQDFFAGWYTDKTSVGQALAMVKHLVDHFAASNAVLDLDGVYMRISATHRDADKDAVRSYLEAAKAIKSNVFADYGLEHWPEISPKSVRDKIFLIFKKSNTPLHFREISFLINRANFSLKPVLAQTVHNELIKDKRFVLVGRGIYALKQWGYEPGTIREVIRSILTKNKRPMTVDEIVGEVMQARQVKKSTVLLNLQNFTEFKRTEKNTYTLEM